MHFHTASPAKKMKNYEDRNDAHLRCLSGPSDTMYLYVYSVFVTGTGPKFLTPSTYNIGLTLQMVMVPALTFPTPVGSASVVILLYDTCRHSKCWKSIISHCPGRCSCSRHANTVPFLKTTQEAAAEGSRLLYRPLHWHSNGMSQSKISQDN